MIKVKKFIIFGVFILLFSGILFALKAKEETAQNKQAVAAREIYKQASREEQQSKATDVFTKAINGKEMQVTGRIRIVGSEPFPETVITDEKENNWYIAKESRQALSDYQQQTITVKGTLELKKMVLANGEILGYRRILHKVGLVSVN